MSPFQIKKGTLTRQGLVPTRIVMTIARLLFIFIGQPPISASWRSQEEEFSFYDALIECAIKSPASGVKLSGVEWP